MSLGGDEACMWSRAIDSEKEICVVISFHDGTY